MTAIGIVIPLTEFFRVFPVITGKTYDIVRMIGSDE